MTNTAGEITEITVEQTPKSNNAYMGRNARWQYRAEKERWHWLIKAAIKQRPEKPYNKSRVYITYYFKTSGRRDPDNYSGKMILDPLVREGIIADDSFNNITLTLDACVDRERPRTEITVVNE